MIQSLQKVINNLVLPQYPWIKTFEIVIVNSGGMNIVDVNYFPHSDEESISKAKEHHREVETETFHLFKMLNLDPEYYLNSVWFLDESSRRMDD